MRYIYILGLGLLVIIALRIWEKYEYREPVVKIDPYSLNHQQGVWLGALEWCESRGIKTAINPNDNDGTASYYSFQFKPSTFAHLAQKYAVQGKISDYEAQKEIVKRMITDKSVNLAKQFPGCVKKLGLPPRDLTNK